MPLTIHTTKTTKSIDVNSHHRLSFLIQQAGISLDLQCSGLGICRRCEVKLGPGKYRIEDDEVMLKADESRLALACRTKVLSHDAEVTVPDRARLKSEGKIYDDFIIADYPLTPQCKTVTVTLAEPTLEVPCPDVERLTRAIEVELGDREIECDYDLMQQLADILRDGDTVTCQLSAYRGRWKLTRVAAGKTELNTLAVAIDIGTTTVALILVDLTTGNILTRASMYNQQMSRADDVASRISAASVSQDDLKYMKDLVVNDTINKLISRACEMAERSSEDIVRVAVSGNTVMSHLFLGLPPFSIGVLPFQPVMNHYPDCTAGNLGIDTHPKAVVSIVPSIAGYIGGDITSDLYVADLKGNEELTALVDLGTNSEMVLIDGAQMYACAAAAGPAFEGAGMRCGCRATAGAIERISFNQALEFTIKTIDGVPPIGICGSAIIDFIADGFRCGLINPMGRFDIELLRQHGKYLAVKNGHGDVHACLLVPGAQSDTGEDIFVSEADVEQILKAKAAVYAGLKTLLDVQGHGLKDLQRLILAGGFAKYINIDNAVSMGMLPKLPETARMETIGNGSLAGAYLSMVTDTAAPGFRELTEIPEMVALNTIPDFEMNFIDALMIPNYNTTEFE